MNQNFDVIVIGAGMAGASVSAELSEGLRVLLIERESQPGYHSTGRSAALFSKSYGPSVIRALSRASETALTPHLSPRGELFVARADQADEVAAMHEELGDAVTPVSGDEMRALIPILRDEFAASGLSDPSASDIEVHGLHQTFLNRLRGNGGEVALKAEVKGLVRNGDWQVETTGGTFSAPIVVNASGAWADEVARLAGVAPLGLTPKRRTALLVAPPAGATPEHWPLTVGISEDFYLKPDAGQLLISPADATPTAPCDAQPEELDIAHCVDRIERAFDLSVRRIAHKWAGLRSFLPDGSPAAGYDAKACGFFWLAGQGGYGIQTAPALARTAAALVRGEPIPGDIAAQGVTAEALSPSRF